MLTRISKAFSYLRSDFVLLTFLLLTFFLLTASFFIPQARADVVKLTIFVVDVAGLPTIRAVRDEFVDVQRPPTSSLVKVAGLFLPDVLIEVEAVACVAG